MGEIKSTLELVMEKTGHLSMSDEERQRFNKEDFQRRLQGLLQRYSDGALAIEALEKRIAALEAGAAVSTDRGLVLKAVLARVAPDGDNERWIALLGKLFPAAADSLKELLAAHREKMDGLVETVNRRLLDRLRQDHGIGGSAVACNPEIDGAYRKRATKLQEEARGRIDAIS